VRRIPSQLLLIVCSLAGIVSSACQAGGVGDPCIPEDEYRTQFPGYNYTEVNVESRSFQCETRVCLVANFNGRVSCPYGVKAKSKTDPSSDNTGAPDDQCWVPGTHPGSGEQNRIQVAVPGQLVDRPPEKAVYCSCRCDGPDKNVRYCECPSGYLCQKLVTDYGFAGGQLAGSYCIKDGTAVADPSKLGGIQCDGLAPASRGQPRPVGCGPKQPNGI
jgi:hypothetical protein